MSQAERTVMVGRHRNAITCAADGDVGDGCVCTCVRVCVHTRVRAYVYACVYARVRMYMRDVFAIYDKIFDPG